MENKNLLQELDQMLARSGYEMLVARAFTDEVFRKGYHQGAREMEDVWHDIISDLKQKVLDEEPSLSTEKLEGGN